jgi:hypothetical protein
LEDPVAPGAAKRNGLRSGCGPSFPNSANKNARKRDELEKFFAGAAKPLVEPGKLRKAQGDGFLSQE